MDARGAPGEGQLIDGSLRIDVLTDAIIRVRYCHGNGIPANDTPMVVRQFAGPEGGRSEASSQCVTLHTAEATIGIGLRPFSLTVRSTAGRPLCEIGGHEKNFFGGWDTYNTGICYAAPDGQPLAVECFSLHRQEAIYGFGEQFIGLDSHTRGFSGVVGCIDFTILPA